GGGGRRGGCGRGVGRADATGRIGATLMRLTASDLACVRGGRTVFRALSFALGAGEALLVTGPNAAGKSSLLRLAAGLLRPQQGRIEPAGADSGLTIGQPALSISPPA